MKRYGGLWDQVTDPVNIELAYNRAAKGKRWQRTVQQVESRKDEALEEVRRLLVDKEFTTAPYRSKEIYEPKKRTIYILPFFPDRIVQHAVMAVVAPIWDRMFDPGSHACRPRKGQHTASRAVSQYTRTYRYALQADVRKFYPSVNQDIAMAIVHKKIKDKNVLWLLDNIIRSFPGTHNVPIGNLTSQWLGNLYLNELDRFVRSEISPAGYARYNDDFLLFGNDKKDLHQARLRCRQFLKEELDLTMAKDRVYPVREGVDFVGYRHFPGYVLVRKRTARRIRKRIAQLRYELKTYQVTLEKARSVIASTSGWLRWANTKNLREAWGIDILKEAVCAQIQ